MNRVLAFKAAFLLMINSGHMVSGGVCSVRRRRLVNISSRFMFGLWARRRCHTQRIQLIQAVQTGKKLESKSVGRLTFFISCLKYSVHVVSVGFPQYSNCSHWQPFISMRALHLIHHSKYWGSNNVKLVQLLKSSLNDVTLRNNAVNFPIRARFACVVCRCNPRHRRKVEADITRLVSHGVKK